jgi:hypothetical protein
MDTWAIRSESGFLSATKNGPCPSLTERETQAAAAASTQQPFNSDTVKQTDSETRVSH